MKSSPFELLQRKFPENQYVVMEEVSDAAGFHRSRSADFIIVGLWPSRGLPVIGVELKSHRSDWLSELKNPAKAENIFKYCDQFYLLTSEPDVAKLEEIPPTWGWMNITGQRIKIIKEAPKLTPGPISKHFLAAMLKRASNKTNWVHRDSIKEEIERRSNLASNHGKGTIMRLEAENLRLEKIISDFEAGSGISLHRWTDNIKIGQAVKFISNGSTGPLIKELKDLEKTASDVLQKIKEATLHLKNST